MSGGALADGATDYLERLVRERERTGLDTLKVGFNRNDYIQISRGQSHLAPINYMRRQTLKTPSRSFQS